MKNFAPELIEQARNAKSVEELLALAKENCVEMTEEEAQIYFEQLHPAFGEISDNELDNVTGGACTVNEKGKSYTVVSSGLSCINGQYLSNIEFKGALCGYLRRDNLSLREAWACFSSPGKCGYCYYLEFDGTTGYCKNSGR